MLNLTSINETQLQTIIDKMGGTVSFDIEQLDDLVNAIADPKELEISQLNSLLSNISNISTKIEALNTILSALQIQIVEQASNVSIQPIEDLQAENVQSALEELKQSGGGGGATYKNLFSATSRQTTFNLSDSFRNYDFILLTLSETSGGNVYKYTQYYKVSTLANGNRIGCFNDGNYFWMNVINDIQFTFSFSSNVNQFLQSVDGFKISEV